MLTENKIKKLNDKFNSLSKAEQRVLIARDVLTEIKAEKYIPKTGSYIKEMKVKGFIPYGANSIQKHFDEITCNCCALGACLLSTTKFKNKLEFNDVSYITSSDSQWGLLNDTFSGEQLTMIEYAFEKEHSGTRVGESRFRNFLDKGTENACVEFGCRFSDSSDRMIAIMKNIIKNKGEFKP